MPEQRPRMDLCGGSGRPALPPRPNWEVGIFELEIGGCETGSVFISYIWRFGETAGGRKE
jgi:hypothetical protein